MSRKEVKERVNTLYTSKRREKRMEPLKRVFQPMKKGLDVLVQGIKDMQKLLDNLEEALSGETPKKRAKAKTRTGKKVPARKTVAKRKSSNTTATDAVLTVIKGNSGGVTTEQIKEKTGFGETKIRGIVSRLKQQNKIRSKGRGVYIKR
jgi:hypothetical protein